MSFVPLSSLEPSVWSFLAQHGFAGEQLLPIQGDASARSYFRLPGKGLLLMQDRDDPVALAAYLRLSRLLNSLGLSAPRVFGADPPHGLALVEDFGEGTYSACLQAGENEATLYRLAVDALLHLHHRQPGAGVSEPHYNLSTYLSELDIFSNWFAPAVEPTLDRDAFASRFRALWAPRLAPVAERADTIVLRDFHIGNLMLLRDRIGVASCGLLDFQDGVLGACEYDLVSLLQDARRDIHRGLEQELLNHYIENAPAWLGDAQDIRSRYLILGAQRHVRIAGVFVRLYLRDRKPRYLEFLPRVLRQVKQALEAAQLCEVTQFLDAELPDWQSKGVAFAERKFQQESVFHV